MLEDDCPICSGRRKFIASSALIGLERRRFPRGKLACDQANLPWHLDLEQLQLQYELSSSEAAKQVLQQEIEAILLEFCIPCFEFAERL